MKNKGITLIALVVTIIVLLILAGITITMVVGENGIVELAKRAAQKTENTEGNEIKDLNNLSDYTHELLDEGNTSIKQVTDETPGELVGIGTETNPYLIESIEDLVAFSNEVAEGNTFEEKVVRLSVSLDFQSDLSYRNPQTTEFNDVNGDTKTEPLKTELTTGGGFNPIGPDETHPFKGTFNGGKHAIKNLYINEKNNYVGLFGYAGENSSINNIIMTDVNITTTESYAGGLVGRNDNGIIENVKTEGGTVKAKEYAGGIVGQNDNGGSIILCSNSANISENGVADNTNHVGVQIGGIVGNSRNNSIVKECLNIGKITALNGSVGGIVGNSNVGGTVEKCQNKGEVTSTGKAAQNIAGIVGWCGAGTIKECENTGKITGTSYDVGGIVGDIKNEGATVISCANEGIIEGKQRVGGIAGIVGEGTTSKVKIVSCTNNGAVTGDKNIGGIAGYSYNTVIDSCSNNGIITGKGIWNVDDHSYYACTGGIVGQAVSQSEIKNSRNHNEIKSRGICVGGISGWTMDKSSIYDCYNEGKIGSLEKEQSIKGIGGISGYLKGESTISRCYNKGEINGEYYVGGISGWVGQSSNSYIDNCYNKGVVKSIKGQVGGIACITVRATGVEITNCYNVGNVSATEPTNSYIRRNCRNWKFK